MEDYYVLECILRLFLYLLAGGLVTNVLLLRADIDRIDADRGVGFFISFLLWPATFVVWVVVEGDVLIEKIERRHRRR